MIIDYGQNLAMNYILNYFNFPYTVSLYNAITNDPLQILINMIAVKYGVSPLIISMILTFLL